MNKLIIGKSYKVQGRLYDTATGEVFIDSNGNEVTSCYEFTADSSNMTVELEFTFDSTEFSGRTITVFEDLYCNDVKAASHSDISDTSQQIHYPSIITVAKDVVNGERITSPSESMTISDTISLSNIDIGENFLIKGVIYDKDTKDKLIIDGNEVTGSSSFISQEDNASLDVMFDFDASTLAGKDIVCFEYLYVLNGAGEEVLVTQHTDINYAGQTIKFTPSAPPEADTSTTPETSDSSAVTYMMIIFTMSLLILTCVIIIKKVNKEEYIL